MLARKTLFQEGPGGVESVLSFTRRERPVGEKFGYASAETQVLALVLREASGMPLAEYLSEKIWQPMGAEADASWLVDGGGHEIGYMGLNATLRDWGRLGLLLANGGALNGRQIIPAERVRAATTVQRPHLAVGAATPRRGYGYQTWLLDREGRFALLGARPGGVRRSEVQGGGRDDRGVSATAGFGPRRAARVLLRRRALPCRLGVISRQVVHWRLLREAGVVET